MNWLGFALVFLISFNVDARSDSILSITPASEINVQIMAHETVEIRYFLTNNTSIERVFTLKKMPGIKQIQSGTQSCPDSLKLNPEQTCLLTLSIDGDRIAGNSSAGLFLCEDNPAGKVCFQPDTGHQFKVIKSAASKARLKIRSSTVVLPVSEEQSLTITNLSKTITARNVTLHKPQSLQVIEQNADDCKYLLPGKSCQLKLKYYGSSYLEENAVISGDNTMGTSIILVSELPDKASLAITDLPKFDFADSLMMCKGMSNLSCVITLYRRGPSSKVTVKNLSSTITITDLTASFTGTALEGRVSVNTCAIVRPGKKCTLTFTPKNTAVPLTQFTIAGNHSGTAVANMKILSAPIACDNRDGTGCSLLFSVNGASKNLIMTNLSPVKVTNIKARLTGTSLAGNLAQNSTSCATVLAGHTCSLIFTPGSTMVTPAVNVQVYGTNTTKVQASMQIAEAPISCDNDTNTGCTLDLGVNGGQGRLYVTNNSTLPLNAVNIQPELSGTALDGEVTVSSSSNCTNLPPGQVCIFTFTAGSNLVPLTDFNISGTNTNTVAGSASISEAPISCDNLTNTGCTLALRIGGTTEELFITNNSSTLNAINIQPDLTGTALENQVTVTRTSNCNNLTPGDVCTLTFSPGSTAVVVTYFDIGGNNTNTVVGNAAISGSGTIL